MPKEIKEAGIAAYTLRNELLEKARSSEDELLKSELNNRLTELSLLGIDDDGVPIEDALKEAREDWKSLKNEARGVVTFGRGSTIEEAKLAFLSNWERVRL